MFSSLVRRYRVGIGVQRGDGLGQRMHRALARSLVRSPYAVLVGSDCPGLESSDLENALHALSDGADAVLGPALDGGYWLIGLRHPEASLFRGVDWGTGRVLGQTRVRLRRRGWRWLELAPRSDLDLPRDLHRSGFVSWRRFSTPNRIGRGASD